MAEELKNYLLKKNLYDKSQRPKKTKEAIIYPILSKSNELVSAYPEAKYSYSKFEKYNKKKEYKDLLGGGIVDLPTSFDVIGDIIIIDLSGTDKNLEKKIAGALLAANKNIKVILKKSGQHKGEFRTQDLEWVAGEKRKETIYKENKIKLKLDVEKVYFSPRLSTERKRIYLQVKKGEEILVMFSGCGPYPLVLSKNTAAKEIIGIEKNPTAHIYALYNKEINKAKNVTFLCGDVREIVPGLKKNFDRVLMPLPKGAEDFLDMAFLVSKKGTVIHFYDFEQEEESFKAITKITDFAKKDSKNIEILCLKKCGQYSPGKFRMCVDFKVLSD